MYTYITPLIDSTFSISIRKNIYIRYYNQTIYINTSIYKNVMQYKLLHSSKPSYMAHRVVASKHICKVESNSYLYNIKNFVYIFI